MKIRWGRVILALLVLLVGCGGLTYALATLGSGEDSAGSSITERLEELGREISEDGGGSESESARDRLREAAGGESQATRDTAGTV